MTLFAGKINSSVHQSAIEESFAKARGFGIIRGLGVGVDSICSRISSPNNNKRSGSSRLRGGIFVL